MSHQSSRATRSSQEVPERIRKGKRPQGEAGKYTSAKRNHEQPRGARRAESPQVTRRRQVQPRRAAKNNEQLRRYALQQQQQDEEEEGERRRRKK